MNQDLWQFSYHETWCKVTPNNFISVAIKLVCGGSVAVERLHQDLWQFRYHVPLCKVTLNNFISVAIKLVCGGSVVGPCFVIQYVVCF